MQKPSTKDSLQDINIGFKLSKNQEFFTNW